MYEIEQPFTVQEYFVNICLYYKSLMEQKLVNGKRKEKMHHKVEVVGGVSNGELGGLLLPLFISW